MLAALNFGMSTSQVKLDLQRTLSGDKHYTTSDRVEGFVSITTTSDLPLGKLNITLQGKAMFEQFHHQRD